MLRFLWNGLRPGDHVLVHDDGAPGAPVLPAVVLLVETGGTTNDVAVRMSETAAVLRPSRLTVHLDPIDSTEPCWRCESAQAPAGVPASPSVGAAAGAAIHA